MSKVVIVQRGAGDIEGTEIMEGLATSEAALVSRGRAEIDANTSVRSVSLGITYLPTVRKGQLMRVYDDEYGGAYTGMVMSVSHAFEDDFLYTQVELEVPVETVN